MERKQRPISIIKRMNTEETVTTGTRATVRRKMMERLRLNSKMSKRSW
jgi:hypothetical protein